MQNYDNVNLKKNVATQLRLRRGNNGLDQMSDNKMKIQPSTNQD